MDGTAKLAAMNVLVATDGSTCAGVALDFVAGIRWPTETTIRVAQVVELGAELFGGPWPAVALVESEAIERDLLAAAERTVHDAGDRLAREGLNVEPVVLRGRPASVINEEAGRITADVIVVGSRGHGTIGSMLLGSVSAEVIDHAVHPVLVAREGTVDHVLLAWDGSPSSSGAATLIQRWPILHGSHVRVVSVADTRMPWWVGFPEPGTTELVPVYLDAMAASRKEHHELAEGMAARLRSEGVMAEAEDREGDAAEQILAAASAAGTGLIVMGSRGRTGIARILLGSVARNVLHHATCSVLVVRASA